MRTATLIALALLVGGCEFRNPEPGILQCHDYGAKKEHTTECLDVLLGERYSDKHVCHTADGGRVELDDDWKCAARIYGKAERLAFEARLAAAKVPRPPAPKKAPVPKVEPEPEAMQSVPE